jgi:hypothetical protein
LTFKLVDNQTQETSSESLTITLTSAKVTENNTTQYIELGTSVATTVTIKNDSLNVKWQTITGTDANKTTLSADADGRGQRVFPEKSTPYGVIENKFELVFELETVTTVDTTLHFKIFDPDNFIGLGNDAATGKGNGGDNYSTLTSTQTVSSAANSLASSLGSVVIAAGTSSAKLTVIVYPADYPVIDKLPTNTANTIIIDSAHAGDNFIVVVDTDQAKVTVAALGTTEDTRYKGTNQLTHSEILTVWRTLWMEIDQMAAPIEPTVIDPISDGFAYSEKAQSGMDGSFISGTWDTVAPTDAPIDFDVLAQPAQPDITLLRTTMAAACIEVREVDQNPDPENWSWINGDGDSLNPGVWDTETTFERNLPDDRINTGDNIALRSRDVNKNEAEFWCIQAIGAYKLLDSYELVADNRVQLICGICYTTSFMIFSETIRDFITDSSCIRTAVEINQLATLHETLHLFGFVDEGRNSFNTTSDGPIMTNSWYTSGTVGDYSTLNPDQIKRIQEKLYPNNSWYLGR